MKRIVIVLLIIPITLAVFWSFQRKAPTPVVPVDSLESDLKLEPEVIIEESPKEITVLDIPLFHPRERITKKPFGILISLKNSPIPRERFSGYHTGTDWEIFPEESDVDVEVRAICAGKILQKKKVSGYGGVIIQDCVLGEEEVNVLYGHLQLSSSPAEVGKIFSTGEKLAILGAGGSADTDGERKHLHLGIKKGNQIDLRGYVSDKNELANWLDPEKIIFPPVL